MDWSTEVNDIAGALARAQSKMKVAIKNKYNPHFKNHYADLNSIHDASREALTSEGISVIQGLGKIIDAKLSVTTLLLHGSGQFLNEVSEVPMSKADAQAFGSAGTYGCRYALAAMLGLSAEEDDDGTAASTPPGHASPTPRTTIPQAKTVQGTSLVKEALGSDGKVRWTPGDFVPQVGKFKGKKLSEWDTKELVDYADHMNAKAAEIGKPFDGPLAEVMIRIAAYYEYLLKEEAKGPPKPPEPKVGALPDYQSPAYTDADIPF